MNLPTEQKNPFGKEVPATATNAIANSDAERAIQEVQAAMVIAKKFPRDQRKAMDRILNSCTRESLANSAIYSFQRGGAEVTGPSIRLAETLAQEWGNMQFGIRELSSENGVSVVEAFAWDMETNTRQVKAFQVPHMRYSKNKGLTRLTDPRDIYEMVANQGARRLRACILGVIPGDVTEAAVNQCEVTQQSSVEVTPETIKAMLDAFANHYSVTQELIEKRIGKRAEAINAMQLLSLRRIYQSLKDGMSKPADWFEIPVDHESVQPTTTEVKLNRTAKKPAQSEQSAEPDPTPTPASEEKAEPAQKAKEPAKAEHSPAFISLCDQLLKTRTIEEANKLKSVPAVARMNKNELGIFSDRVSQHIEAISAGMLPD